MVGDALSRSGSPPDNWVTPAWLSISSPRSHPAEPPAADTAYDSDAIRRFLIERGTLPVIPNNPTRKRHHPFDAQAYKRRNLIECMVLVSHLPSSPDTTNSLPPTPTPFVWPQPSSCGSWPWSLEPHPDAMPPSP